MTNRQGRHLPVRICKHVSCFSANQPNFIFFYPIKTS